MLAIKPDNMEAITRRHRFGAQFARRQRDQHFLEFGCGLAVRELAKIATLRRRRTA